MANTNSLYQLFGGYSPNERPKKIRRYSAPIDKLKYDPDFLTKEIFDAIEKDMEGTTEHVNPSTYAKKVFVDDVKRALIVQATPQKTSYDATRALEFGQEERGGVTEEEETAGVQLKLNINPYDWATDPEKEFTKFRKELVTSVFNWSDFSSFAEQAALWNPLLNGETDKLDKLTAKLFDAKLNTFQVAKTPYKAERVKTFTIAKDRGPQVVTELYDSPAQVGETFKEFVRKAQNTGARNGAYRAHINVSANSIAQNLQQTVYEDEDFIATASKVTGGTRKRILSDQETKIAKDFINKQEILKDAMRLSGSAKDNVAEHVYRKYNSSEIIKMDQNISWGLGQANSDIAQITLKGILEKPDQAPTTDVEVITKHIDRLGKTREQIIKNINAKIDYYKAYDPTALPEFMHFVAPLVGESYLTDGKINGLLGDNLESVRKSMQNAKDALSKPGVSQAQRLVILNRCKGDISNKIKSFANEGVIGYGGVDVMAKSIGEDLSSGKVAQVLQSNADLTLARNMANVTSQASSINNNEANIDFVRMWGKGGPVYIVTDYMWDRFRTRIDGFAPASVLGEFLQRNHYFGLNYVEDNNKKAYGVAKFMMKSGLFDNKQTLKFKLNDTDKQSLIFKFKGGKELNLAKNEFFDSLNKEIKFEARHYNPLTKKHDGDIILGANFTVILTPKDLVDILNGDISSQLYQDLKIVYGRENAKKFLDAAKDFKQLLLKSKDSLGLEIVGGKIVNSAKNQAAIFKLLSGLNSRSRDANFVSIFSSRAGLLQKLSASLNKVQNFIFKNILAKISKYLKFLNPIGYLKRLGGQAVSRYLMARTAMDGIVKAISSKIASKIATNVALKAMIASLSQSIAGAIDAATGGIATIVSHIIAWIITEVVVKVMDKLQGMLKSIREGTFFEDVVEEGSRNFAKAGITAAACCLFCMALPVMIFMQFFMGSITPVDTTIMSYVDGGHERGGPGGANCNPTTCNGVGGLISCFVWYEETFTGSEGEAALDVLHNAEKTLSLYGDYVTRLCEAGDIYIEWGGTSTACGWAQSVNQISFGNGGCWAYTSGNQELFNFLLAHETGHLFDWRRSEVATLIDRARRLDNNKTLPTYVGGSCTECTENGCLSEDIAETIGNYVSYHKNCPIGNDLPGWQEFWDTYYNHKAAAECESIFGPDGATCP